MASTDAEDLEDLLGARRYALRVLSTPAWRSIYSWSSPSTTRELDSRDNASSSRTHELNSPDASSRNHEPNPHEPSSPVDMRPSCDTSSSMHTTAAAETKMPQDAAPPRTSLQIFIIMLAITLSVFLAALDVSIVTTALPTIAESLGSSSGFTWIGSSYLLAQAATTPLWGKFSDIWGRKPVLLAAVGIFFVGSLICGVARNVATLIVGRAVQGLASGGLLVMDGIIIADLFSMRERGKYYGIIGSTWAIAGALGPPLGGVFAEKASWHWCFLINLPISAAVFGMILFSLHLHNPHTSARAGLAAIDYCGTALVVLSVTLFLLGLSLGSTTHPWTSAIVLTLLLVGLFTFALFLLTEAHLARYPVIPLHIFRSTSTLFCLLAGFIHGLLFIAVAFYLPFYFQAVFFATPLKSGLYFLPFTFAISLSGAGGGIYVQKTGRYIDVILFTFALTTLGLGLFIALPAHKIWAPIITYQLLTGIGIGPNFQILLIAIQSGLPQSDTAVISSVLNFVRTLAMPVGIVLGSVMLNSGLQHQSPTLLASLGQNSTALLTSGNAAANVHAIAALPAAQRAVAAAALRTSLRGLWILFTVFAAVGLLASLPIARRALSSEHVEVEVGVAAEDAKRTQRLERRGTGRVKQRPWDWRRRGSSYYRRMGEGG